MSMYENPKCKHIEQAIEVAYDLLHALLFDDLKLFLNRLERLQMVIRDSRRVSGYEGIQVVVSLLSDFFNKSERFNSELEFKQELLMLATRLNKSKILIHLLSDVAPKTDLIRKLFTVAIRNSSFESLDALFKELDHPNQLIDGKANALTLAVKEGNLIVADYIKSMHCGGFTLEISASQANSFSWESQCSFLSQIIGANQGSEAHKLLCVMYGVVNGIDIIGDSRSIYYNPLEASFVFSPAVSSYLLSLYIDYELEFDLNHLLWLAMNSSELTKGKKKKLLILISSKLDLNMYSLDDELKGKIEECMNDV